MDASIQAPHNYEHRTRGQINFDDKFKWHNLPPQCCNFNTLPDSCNAASLKIPTIHEQKKVI